MVVLMVDARGSSLKLLAAEVELRPWFEALQVQSSSARLAELQQHGELKAVKTTSLMVAERRHRTLVWQVHWSSWRWVGCQLANQALLVLLVLVFHVVANWALNWMRLSVIYTVLWSCILFIPASCLAQLPTAFVHYSVPIVDMQPTSLMVSESSQQWWSGILLSVFAALVCLVVLNICLNSLNIQGRFWLIN